MAIKTRNRNIVFVFKSALLNANSVLLCCFNGDISSTNSIRIVAIVTSNLYQIIIIETKINLYVPVRANDRIKTL